MSGRLGYPNQTNNVLLAISIHVKGPKLENGKCPVCIGHSQTGYCVASLPIYCIDNGYFTYLIFAPDNENNPPQLQSMIQ